MFMLEDKADVAAASAAVSAPVAVAAFLGIAGTTLAATGGLGSFLVGIALIGRKIHDNRAESAHLEERIRQARIRHAALIAERPASLA